MSAIEKVCSSCLESLPLDNFKRRPGQPYFVVAGRAWPQEPLLPQVVEETCDVCFTWAVLRATA